MSFIAANTDIQPDDLLDAAVGQINTTLTANGLPNWTANDAALAVIILGVLSQLWADVAQIQSTVLPAIFRAFGTQLFNIPYQNGTQAAVDSLWTFTGPAPVSGYEIDAGTAVIIDGQTFYTQADYEPNEGDTTATITLVADDSGSAYNDLGGVDQAVQPYQSIDWVQSVITLGVTSGGQNQQDDDDYEDALAAELQLQAPRPIVDSDFSTFVQSNTAENATGIAIGRATSIDGYYPDGRATSTVYSTPTVLTCQLTNGNATVYYSGSSTLAPEVGASITGTGIPSGTTIAASPPPNDTQFNLSSPATTTGSESLTVAAMTGYGPEHLTCVASVTSASPTVTISQGPALGAIPAVGARVTGTDIPNGTVVLASPAPTAAGFTLSSNATATASGLTLSISAWTSVQLAECVIVADGQGEELPASSMDAELAWLETYRPTCYLLSLIAPTYTTIYVTCQVKVSAGYDPAGTSASVQAALLAWLNSANWGGQISTSSSAWVNQPNVYYNKAISIATIQGVDEVVSLTIGTSPSPSGTANLVLPGPAPLPTSTMSTVLVTTA